MAFRSADHVVRSTNGTLTSAPAGLVANDYVAAQLVSDNSGATYSYTTSGLTERINNDQAAPDTQTQRYADKIATGTDDLTVDFTVGTYHHFVCAAFSGRNTSAPRTATQATSNTTSNPTPVSASATGVTAANGDDIFVCWQCDQTVTGDDWSSASYPAGYTEASDRADTNWVSSGCFYKENVGAGATGSITWTITRDAGTGNTGYGAVVVAIAWDGVSGGGQGLSVQLPNMRPRIFAPGLAR